MTTSQLVSRVKALLAYDLDGYFGAAPSDTDVVACLNDALYELGEDAFVYDPSVVLTMAADTASYDLRGTACSRKVLQAFSVTINGVPLWDASRRRPGMWSIDELGMGFPQWRSHASGTPSRAVQYGTTLVLDPPPSASVAALSATIAAQVLPAALSAASPSTEPQLPVELHEALALMAAAKAADPNVTESHQDSRVARMYQAAKAKAQTYGRRSRNSIGGGSTWALGWRGDDVIEL